MSKIKNKIASNNEELVETKDNVVFGEVAEQVAEPQVEDAVETNSEEQIVVETEKVEEPIKVVEEPKKEFVAPKVEVVKEEPKVAPKEEPKVIAKEEKKNCNCGKKVAKANKPDFDGYFAY